jgi:hypothetical protein
LAMPYLAVGHATPPKTASKSTSAAEVQTPPAKPGPEHKKLEIWVGDWTYEGEDKATSFQPARAYTGKARVRLILGGFFVEWHAEESNGKGAWREIDGYDPATKRFFWHAFYANGGVEIVTYAIEGNTVSLSGSTVIGGKQAELRGTCVFASDGRSFVEKLGVSVEGKTWIPAWEIRFAKTNY